MKINESKLTGVISESINEFLNSLGDYSFEEGKKKKKSSKSKTSKKKRKGDKKKEKKINRAQIERYLKQPGVNIAQYAYDLYNVDAKQGKDTNDMKNARSLVYKKRDHEKNENGYPYNFNSDELTKLKGLISANQLSEAVDKAIKNVINEETTGFGNRGARAKINKQYYSLTTPNFYDGMDEDEIRDAIAESSFKIEMPNVVQDVTEDEAGDVVIIVNGQELSAYDFRDNTYDSVEDIEPGDLVFGDLSSSLHLCFIKGDFGVYDDGYSSCEMYGTKEEIAKAEEEFLYGTCKLQNSELVREFIDKIKRGEEF